jgi:hypothetical protein
VRGDSFDSAWRALREYRGYGTHDALNDAVRRLADSAAGTALEQFFPYTSLTRLCFARSPYPFEDVPPAFVSFSNAGDYWVYRGFPYVDADLAEILETTDAAEAIRGLLDELGIA